jgi:hypothetical protein
MPYITRVMHNSSYVGKFGAPEEAAFATPQPVAHQYWETPPSAKSSTPVM